MNSIKYTFAPAQKFFAVVAIFALVAMPMAQVFAQEAPAEPSEVQGQTAPAEPAEQEAPAETPEQKVADNVEASADPAGAELTTFSTCPTNFGDDCQPPAPKPVTIVAEKIVCTDEADLPNWGNNIPAKIDGNTAANWLVNHKSCKLASGWDFEWGLDKAVSDPGGTKVGTAGGNWHTFGSTNTSGKTSVTLLSSDLGRESKVWLREVLKGNYLSFSDLKKVGNTPIGESVSAEFYCDTDGLNYDNYEWINDVDAGETFNCVAWNVPEKGSITIEKKVVGDAKDWSFGFTGSQGEFALTEGEGSSKTFPNLTPGEYSFDETDLPGWDLTDVKCTDDAEPSSVALQTAVPAPTPDAVVTLDPGENITCTFTNTKEVPQTPVCQTEANLLSNGSFEADTVTDASLWQKFSTVGGWAIAKVSDAVATTLELHKGWSGNAAAQGTQYAELDGDQSVRVSQSVVTIPGATYELRWAFAPRQNTDVNQNKLSVEVEGSEVATAGPVAGGAGALLVSDWTAGSKQFVAQDSNTEIAFKDAGVSNSYGTFLDDACLIKIADPKPMCELVLVSDATTMVDDEVDTFAELVSLPLHEAWDATIGGASWIWSEDPLTDAVNDTYAKFLKDFEWYGGVQSATLEVAADNSYEYDLNATSGADVNENNFAVADSYNVLGAIVQGENNLSFDVKNWKQENGTAETNPAGLMYKLTIKGSDPSCNPEPQEFSCEISASETSVRNGEEFKLSWKLFNFNPEEGDVVEYSWVDDEEYTPVSPYETSIKNDTTFTITLYGKAKESVTCHVDVDTRSGGSGGSGSHRKSSGSVLGDSEDRPEGGVAGASTEMPAGAPNTGAGGTSPLVVSLPSLVAVLGARASVQKTR